MKNFLIGIIYTVIVAGILAHFSGCDMPDVSDITSVLTPYATAVPTPSPEPDKTQAETTATASPVSTEVPTETPVATTAEEGITAVDDHVWTIGSVNMRKGPGTEYEKVGVVPVNTEVHRTGICDNGWIRIEYKDITAFISGKYTTSEQSVTKAPTASVTPTPTVTATPEIKATSTPTLVPVASVTATPTPGSSVKEVNDNVDQLIASLSSAGGNVNLETASSFYYETEKSATAGFMKNAGQYTTFSMLYKDKSCMHTPEYFLATYPELCKVEVDYSKSKKYNNGIYVVFNVTMKEGGQYAYAIRTGNTAFLTETESYALKSIMKLSDSLGLEKMSDIDVVLTVHDHLINNTRYDSTYAEISHTPYGLIMNKTAVCDGYAETFMIFMLLNDIDCITVTGYASENHAWNQVYLDGEWYNVDVTWDDPVTRDSETGKIVDNLRYTYFMINDDVLYETHTPQCGYEMTCTSDKYHMYMYKQYLCGSEEDVKAQIDAQIEKESLFFVYRTGDFTKAKIIDIFQNKYNVALSSYEPTEIRKGYMMFEIINPLL